MARLNSRDSAYPSPRSRRSARRDGGRTHRKTPARCRGRGQREPLRAARRPSARQQHCS
nr:MAG TPA: hypothetical protein [Caudoviricetes sp.]